MASEGKTEMEYRMDGLYERMDMMLDMIEHLTKKIDRLDIKKKTKPVEYQLQHYNFPTMRAQNLMKEMLVELLETRFPCVVRKLIGAYNYGGNCSIFRRLIQETFNKPNICSIYIKGLRFYAYTGTWIEWKKPRKDQLRSNFWTAFKTYMSAYMSRDDNYLTDNACWDLLIETDYYLHPQVTKREYIKNIIKSNNELDNLTPPIGNTSMVTLLLKNEDLMIQNRQHFKKRLK